jgi:hypothetical protein
MPYRAGLESDAWTASPGSGAANAGPLRVPERLEGVMANFPTHIAIGTIVSGALATVTLAADVVAPENLVAVTLAGVLGSVLPDIDLKDSRPSQAMFSGLAVFASFVVLFTFATRYSVAEMMILWLATLIIVRFGGRNLFYHFSVHRGIWHSLLAGAFCAFVTAGIFYYGLGRHEGVAWLAAGFMFVGYITHLTLDEIYSVDVMDTRIKSSFGTALKFYDHRYPIASGAMAAAVVLAFFITPSTKTFRESITSHALWTELRARMLPQDRDRWFGIEWHRMALLRSAPAAAQGEAPKGDVTPAAAGMTPDPLSTGSLPPRVEEPAPAPQK